MAQAHGRGEVLLLLLLLLLVVVACIAAAAATVPPRIGTVPVQRDAGAVESREANINQIRWTESHLFVRTPCCAMPSTTTP